MTDSPDSPHRLVPKLEAQYLFAIAENDDESEPETKEVLRKAFAERGLSAEIEVYEGALFNSRLVDADGSVGVHNPRLTIVLLESSIAALAEG